MIKYCIYRFKDIEYHEATVLELDYPLRKGDKIEIDYKMWEVADACVMSDNYVIVNCKYLKNIDKLL